METGFLANREKQSAMIRRIEIIGEAAASVAQGSPLKPCGFSRSFVLFHGLDANPCGMGSWRYGKEIEEPQGYNSNPALHLNHCGF